MALPADGNTAIVGGPEDNGYQGAAWIFTRTHGVWSQQGTKLIGSGAVGPASQGFAVAISADGNTALIGGYGDNGEVGTAGPTTGRRGLRAIEAARFAGADEIVLFPPQRGDRGDAGGAERG